MWGSAAGFYVIAMFHRMSLAVASLDASERFGLPVETIALLSALQLFLYLAMIIPAGILVDRIGPRWTLTLGLVGMGIGQSLFGITHDAVLALAARALIGAGDALIFLCVLRLAQSWFAPRHYAPLALLTAGAGAVGQLATTIPLGGALDALGWTPVFLGSGLLTLVAAVTCIVVVRDRPAGVPTPAGGPRRTGIAHDLRAAWARAGTRRGFWTHFTLMGPFVAITALWGYPYLVKARDLSEGTARAWLLACVALCALSSPLFGRLMASAPHLRESVVRVVALSVAGLWLVALAWPGGSPLAVAVAALLVTGPACSAAMLAFDIARADNPPERAGIATGLANTGGFIAAVTMQVSISVVLYLAGDRLDIGLAMLAVPLIMLPGLIQILRPPIVPGAPLRVGDAHEN